MRNTHSEAKRSFVHESGQKPATNERTSLAEKNHHPDGRKPQNIPNRKKCEIDSHFW
jgi:hypothetical protein